MTTLTCLPEELVECALLQCELASVGRAATCSKALAALLRDDIFWRQFYTIAAERAKFALPLEPPTSWRQAYENELLHERFGTFDADARSNTIGNFRILKLLMTGPASVGKTSFLQRLTEDHFTTTFGTIGVDFKIKCVKLDGESLKLQIWDTAGQERFRTITASYYRGSMGIAICYDVQDRRSFEDLPYWLELKARSANVGTPAVIIGMKADDAARREVSVDEGRAFAKSHGMPFAECSAKDGLKSVEHAACQLTRAALRRQRELHAERQFQITAPPPTRRRCGDCAVL